MVTEDPFLLKKLTLCFKFNHKSLGLYFVSSHASVTVGLFFEHCDDRSESEVRIALLEILSFEDMGGLWQALC